MMQTSGLVFILHFALIGSALAQGTQAPSVADKKSLFVQEAFVIEKSVTKVKFENDGTSLREQSATVRIQSDAGIKRFGLLTFSYEDATGTFELGYVRVRKPDGTVVATSPDGVQDMAAEITREAPFYSDLREKHVAVKGLEIGDVLEFAYEEKVTKPLIPGQFWFAYNFSRDEIVTDELLEVSVPKDRAIKMKKSDVKPAMREENGYRVYAWSTSNLEHTGDLKQKQDQDKATWELARGRLPQAEVLISSFQSWDEIGRWYQTLQSERAKPNAEIQAKAAELIKGATDDAAKMRAIYQYVSTRFRYIGVAFGIGRYQPHAAGEVLGNQYGDCKDKHTLLASLLSAAGIKAYPALISSQRDLDEDVPSPGQFDHMITFVPAIPDPLWLDSTGEVAPFGYLISPLRDKRALVVFDDKPAAFSKTPVDPPFRSTEDFHMDAKIGDNGTLVGNADFSMRGDQEYLFRTGFRAVPLPNWKDLMQRVSYSLGFGGDVSEVTAGSPEKTDEPFHVAYKYARKEFGDWPNRRIMAAVPGMGLPVLQDEDHKPSHPVWLGPPADFNFHSAIEIPSGYTVELPQAIHEKHNFADYDATYEYKDGKFVCDRRMEVKQHEVSPDDFEEYKKFRKMVVDDYDSFVPLSSTSRLAQAPESPAGASAASIPSFAKFAANLPDSTNKEAQRLFAEANTAADRHDVPNQTSSLYRAVTADPKYTRAWLALGALLTSSQQTEAGNEAFRKAIDSDPTQPDAYRAYALALTFQSKFAEAVPVFQSLLKIVPTDVDGARNLYFCLAMLKKYDEGVGVLEAASKLSPNERRLQNPLASAYLKTGQADKAEPLFRKLLESDSSANALNNVAYQMADNGKLLPLAKEYAEKAVKIEEAASQKTSLPQLQKEDLGRTAILSAYWDTLGFVDYKMGDSGQAEKYLKAAWMVSQSGFAASHLCDLYDSQHKVQAAVRMCQLAEERLPLLAGPDMPMAMGELARTKAHLAQLHPGAGKPTGMDSAVNEVTQMRRFNLARLVPGTASADFFVLLVSDSKTSSFRVEDVKFVSGSDKVKSFAKTLTSIHFNMPSPDDGPTRVVRRGILGCYQYTGCSFVLLDPDSVQLN